MRDTSPDGPRSPTASLRTATVGRDEPDGTWAADAHRPGDLPPVEAVTAGDPIAAAATLDTHFQPIVAVRRGGVLGVEALTRARGADGGHLAPAELFAAAERAGTAPALDRACRRLAVARFAPLHRAAPELVCFVNCHVSTFLADADGPDGWPALAEAARVDPRSLALEVLEAQSGELPALAEATARYRRAGFLVVIDDVGAGHSNLDRVAAIRPDLLKADRSLVHGCADDRVQRAVLRALVGLSEELGGWVIAEGVECEADALAALDLGVDLVQGYHLGRPAPLPSLQALDDTVRRARTLAERYRARTQRRVGAARELRDARAQFARATAATLAPCPPSEWERLLGGALAHAPGDPAAASAAVLDATGMQETPTVRRSDARAADRRERSLIFHPPAAGADHAHKEYVYLLGTEPGAAFESAPYVPLPNEKLCVTVSTVFAGADGATRVLALHLDAGLQGPMDAGPPGDALGDRA